jgi:SHS2 domain-containing protein
MSYRFFEHTADLGVEIEASSFEGLLIEGLRALTDSMTEVDEVRLGLEILVDLVARSQEDLLVDWLNEVVFLFDTQAVLLRQADLEVESRVDGWHLRGKARGEHYDSDRHKIKTLIKAVTYHQLEVRRSMGGWTARVVFDI